MNSNSPKRALLISVAILSSVPILRAQAPEASSESLQSLGDDRLMNELANRGLDSLLDRYFETHHTPDAQQKAIRSSAALRDLNNPKLSYAQKEQRVRQVAEGIGTILSGIKDPERLGQDAGLLLDNGVLPDATLLERWGESPSTQARLRPVADAVYKMLGQASREAGIQAQALSSRITPANQTTVGAQWQKLDTMSQMAQYGQNMMVYYLVLALPKEQRPAVAEPAIKYLAQFDNPESGVQPRVRLMLGKLDLALGQYDPAIKLLDSVAKPEKEIQPVPDPGMQYEARYTATSARMLSGSPQEAQKELDFLLSWQRSAMSKDADTQKLLAANAAVLQYRIDLALADKTTDATARKSLEAAARDVLLKLSNEQPEYRGLIFQQLVERLPKDLPVAQMDPLLLQGLMSKARSEASRTNNASADVLQRGLDAAAEVLRRKDAPGITVQMRDEAARLIPTALEAMGKKVEAALAYLQYAQQNAVAHPQTAEAALDDAGRLTFDLRKTDPDNPRVVDLYDRFLPAAINPPFSRTVLAYFYAQRLRLEKKSREAIRYFRMVAKADKNYGSAQYFTMRCLQEMLDDPRLPAAQRATLTNELLQQVRQVREQYAGSKEPSSIERSALATLAESKVHLRAAVGTAPEFARGEAQKALDALNGFEQSVQATPDQKALLSDALLTRVNAYMTLGDLKQATAMLVTLLNQSGGAEGADYVKGLLERLDKSLEQAEAQGKTDEMRSIAQSEAELSGFLVEWARKNPDERVRNFTYQYMVFDARTKRLAGTLATNASERTRLLDEAAGAYKLLKQPQYVKMYQATLPKEKVDDASIDPNQPDPNVQLGIALTDFELKNYKEASDLLGDLLNNGKLGGPTMSGKEAGGENTKLDNDVYWEATYKLYRSNTELSKGADDAALAGTKQGLKGLLIRGGIPARWQDKFASLRKQIIPDFDVARLAAPPASTEPVSSR